MTLEFDMGNQVHNVFHLLKQQQKSMSPYFRSKMMNGFVFLPLLRKMFKKTLGSSKGPLSSGNMTPLEGNINTSRVIINWVTNNYLLIN